MPVSGNIVYHLCCHNGVSDGGMSHPDPAQASLTDSTGKRYGSVTICTAAAAGSMPTVGFRRVSNILSPRAFTRPISSACAPASSPVVSVSRKTGPSANRMCQHGEPATLTLHPGLQAQTCAGQPLFFCLRAFRPHRDAVSQPPYAVFPAVRTFVHSDRFRTRGWLHPELIPKPPFGVAFILRPGRFITGV